MSRNSFRTLPIVTALMLAGVAMPAFAQRAPQPGAQQRAAVRDILNRAETEQRRRTLGDVLGGITGISKAAAQTAPPAATQAPTTTNRPVAVAAGPSQSTPASSQRPTAATRRGGQATAATQSGGSGLGTPSDPSMIATVPLESDIGGAPPSQGVADLGSAPDAIAAEAPDAAAPLAEGVSARRTVIADGSPHRAFRRSAAYGHAPEWCAPDRW